MQPVTEVISEFFEFVNMTAAELDEWLKSNRSKNAGQQKDNGDGETVGHESGRKIVEILEGNPEKEEDKYTDEQISHMRKVISYCKRHLAQEGKANSEKPTEQVKKTKSYASLKNWGHDVLKAQQDAEASPQEELDQQSEEVSEEVGEEDGDPEPEPAAAGEKRKAGGGQAGANKKRELDAGDAVHEEDESEEEDQGAGELGFDGGQQGDDAGEGSGQGDAAGLDKGDTVSWNWGNGQPQGKVLDVKAEDTSIKTKKGNEVSRKGTREDPAVVLDTGKSKAIKLSHELNET